MSSVGTRRISGTPSALWSFVGRDDGRAVVGDGGRHDDEVGRVGSREHGLGHLGGGLDLDHLDAGGDRQVGRGHEGDLGAELGGDLGQGVALPPRGAVREVADRVDRLAGAPGGDEHAPARERTAARAPPRRRGEDPRPPPRRSRSVSGRRPAPDVPAGQAAGRPARGRGRRGGAGSARFSCTAGCSHISVCIAGQTSTGARVASSVATSRSEEIPAA